MNPSQPTEFFTVAQRRAIEHLGSPLVIVGGPGTGKTRVVTERARWLVENGHAGAFGTLVVTFGNRAARELAARLHELLPPEAVVKLHVKTISGMCLELLSTFGDVLGYKTGGKRLRVIQAGDARELLADALADALSRLAASGSNRVHAESIRQLSPDVVAQLISKAKFAGIGPERYEAESREPVESVIAEVYAGYQARLLTANVLDYGDLILRALELLEGRAEARSFAHEIFCSILVDEFQDVSFTEWRILQALCGPGALVTVAGDTAQTIHTWRGAMGAQCFDRFRDRFPDSAVVELNENHRSNRHIVAVSGCLLDAGQQQVARNDGGAPVALVRACSEHEEAALVTAALDALVKGGFAAYADCAVTCRTNAQVDALEKALLRANIPYRLIGQGTIFQHPAVRAILGYLAMAVDPCDDYAVRQVARLHFTREDIDRLRGDADELRSDHLFAFDAAHDRVVADKITRFNRLAAELAGLDAEGATPLDAIDRVLAITPILLDNERSAERIALLKHLAQAHATIQDFLREVEVWNGEDPIAPGNRDQVAVMTLHAAKGLEFKACFVVGANEGVLPHFNTVTPSAVADERRLMYVGVTRGKDLTVVTYARERAGRPAAPSRFLQGWPSGSVARLDRGQALDFFSSLRPAPAEAANPR